MKKIKNILLIYPSQWYSHEWGQYLCIKPQLLNIFSYLKHKGYNVDVLDLELEIGRPKNQEDVEFFLKKSEKLIAKYEFNIIGISCYTSLSYLSTLAIAKICKRVNQQCVIVTGGYHPSVRPEDFIFKNTPIDFIIKGEGEICFDELCNLDNKRVATNKPIMIQGKALLLDNKVKLDWETYPYTRIYRQHRNMDFPINLSRECPFSCIYCMESSKSNIGWRSYPISKSIKEIAKIVSVLGPKQISFVEPCFGFSKKWRREFLKELIALKVDCLFWANTRIDLMEDGDIDLFSKLNFQLEFGVESFSEKMLTIMRKTNNPKSYLQKAYSILKYASRKEQLICLNFMFNHPGETKTTIRETLNFLHRISEEIKTPSFLIKGQDYAFFQSSGICDNLHKYQRIYGTRIKYLDWWKRKTDYNEAATDMIPSRSLAINKDSWKLEFTRISFSLQSRLSPQVKLLLWGQVNDLKKREFTNYSQNLVTILGLL